MAKKNGINWMSHNAVPILFALISWAATFGVLYTKVETVIANQNELKLEVREWRKQYEQRLGQTEVHIAVIEQKIK